MLPSSFRELDPLHEILFTTNLGRDSDKDSVFNAFSLALQEENPAKRTYLMGILLNGLMAKGPTKEEVRGLLDAAFTMDGFMPEQRQNFPSKKKTITLAGSGKKGYKTVNISSLAAIVAACHGELTILKLCSPSTSSVTGSQDFFSLIGGNMSLSKDQRIDSTNSTGIGFFPVEDVLPQFASVYSGWYYAPHAMSFALAGMACEYKTDYLLYGLAHPNITLSMEVFRGYGYPQAMVVTSTFDGVHYVDELFSQCGVAIQGYQHAGDINPRKSSFYVDDVIKLDYSLPVYQAVSQQPTIEENVTKGLSAFLGNDDLAQQVAVNAAAILVASEVYNDFNEAYKWSYACIQSGEPIDKLRQLVSSTNGDLVRLQGVIDQAKSSNLVARS